MSLFIVRHGQTNDNANRILQHPDSPLSAVGHEQAMRLAERMADENISQIIASDYLRTQQTAEHIAAKIGVKVHYEPLLRERNFGDFRGIAYGDLEVHPFAPDVVPPNGESWSDFYERMAEAWQLIMDVANGTQNLLVVTHGLVCDALIEKHLYLPEQVKNASRVANTSVTKVATGAPWQVQLHQCVSHLADMDNIAPVGRA